MRFVLMMKPKVILRSQFYLSRLYARFAKGNPVEIPAADRKARAEGVGKDRQATPESAD